MKHAKANSSAKRTYWSQKTPFSNNTREDPTHGHQQMVNNEIRLIIFFAAKDGEALYIDSVVTDTQVLRNMDQS